MPTVLYVILQENLSHIQQPESMKITSPQNVLLIFMLGVILIPVCGTGQCNPNLVPNPGFETGRCGIPAGTPLELYSVHNISQSPTLDNWYNPTNATPDWYNSCTGSVSYTPPVTSAGGTYNVQDVRIGSTAHAGFLSYGDSDPQDNIKADYREYMQVQLTAPLVAGTRYHVSFYVNLAAFEPAEVVYTSNTAYFNYNFRIFGTDKIGAYFSNGPMTDYTLDPLNTVIDVEPQIEYIGAPITEAEDWVLISGSFIAAGGEEYMTIGNFRYNNETNFELVRNASTDFSRYPDQVVEPIFQITEYAYYMLDDVSVVEEPIVNTVDAGPDSTLNEGDSYAIPTSTTGTSPVSYVWTPANSLDDPTLPSPTASPTETTTYTVTVDFGDGCPVTDQITITVNPCSLTIDITNATSGFIDCNLAQTDITGIVVNNASPSATYTWTDIYGNVVGNQLILNNVGIGGYDLVVSDGPNCEERISWGVDGDQGLSFLEGVLQQSCPTSGNNDGYISGITGFPIGGTYVWTDESGTILGNGGGINNLGAGIYTVTYTNGTSGFCSISRTFDLTENGICSDNCPGLITVEPYANNDRDNVGTFVIDLGDTVSLYAGVSSSVSLANADYAWSTSGNPDFHLFQILSNISPTATTTYTVEVDFGNGCIRSGSITVIVNDPACPIQLLDGTVVDSGCGSNDGGVENITVLNGIAGETYTWTDGNGMLVGNSLVLSNVPQGEYTLTVDQGGGCQRSRTWTVGTTNGFSINAGADVNLNSGASVSLAATPTGTPISYSWTPATGLDDATLANPTASPTVTTTYTVTADFGGGCIATDMVTVSVNNPPVNCSGTNLVMNPSFENLNDCPLGSSLGPGCHPSDPTWEYHNNLCFAEGWINATPATPDIISAPCAAASTLMTPVGEEYRLANSVQASRTGTNHAGIYTYASLSYDPGIDNYSEYITIQLANPLTANLEYTVRFYVNLSDISQVATSLGAYFSSAQVQGTGFSMIQVTPNIETTINITEMNDWIEVTGTFVASGGEAFLTIGRFNSGTIDDTQQVTQQTPGTNNDVISYYFIDDVSVTETLGTLAVNAGPDVTINAGESTQLEALPTGGTPVTYSWTPTTGLDDATIANPMASPTMTTLYTVTTDFGGGCTATDAVMITVVDPNCPLMLSGGSITDATCQLNDGGITGITVTGSSGNESYVWTNGNGMVIGMQLDLPNVGLGSYTLTVTEDTSCERALTFMVNESGPPDLDDTGLELTNTTCEGRTGSISGIAYIGEEVAAVFSWTDALGTTVGDTLALDGVGAGTYTLQVIDAFGCGAIAGPYVIGSPADCQEGLPEEGPVRIANTMTPNGDGANDMFYIEGIEAYPNCRLIIYNRWGSKVYETNNYQNNWYGSNQGNPLPVATYYYLLNLGDAENTSFKGAITILK